MVQTLHVCLCGNRYQAIGHQVHLSLIVVQSLARSPRFALLLLPWS